MENCVSGVTEDHVINTLNLKAKHSGKTNLKWTAYFVKVYLICSYAAAEILFFTKYEYKDIIYLQAAWRTSDFLRSAKKPMGA